MQKFQFNDLKVIFLIKIDGALNSIFRLLDEKSKVIVHHISSNHICDAYTYQ